VRRERALKRFGPKPAVALIDPPAVLSDWPLGQFDECAAALVRSSGLASRAALRSWQGVLTHDVVALLAPSAKRADHYRLFDGAGISIGAVVVRRSRWSPRLITDKTIQFVDCTGRAFVVDWWSSKATTAFSGETSAMAREGGTWRVLGRSSADHAGRWLLGDACGELLAWADRRRKGSLLNPAGQPLARLGEASTRWTWPWRRPPDGYSRACVVAFDRACNPDTRALALSAMMCAEIQWLEDLNVDLDFGD
jgi:hypothetical protein